MLMSTGPAIACSMQAAGEDWRGGIEQVPSSTAMAAEGRCQLALAPRWLRLVALHAHSQLLPQPTIECTTPKASTAGWLRGEMARRNAPPPRLPQHAAAFTIAQTRSPASATSHSLACSVVGAKLPLAVKQPPSATYKLALPSGSLRVAIARPNALHPRLPQHVCVSLSLPLCLCHSRVTETERQRERETCNTSNRGRVRGGERE